MNDTKTRLLNLYESALEEATSYYKSEYSASSTEDEERDVEDKESLMEFKQLLDLL